MNMEKTRVAVVLSGCGVYDGAEIHESVFTLLALDRAGVDYQCLAPDIKQFHVVNHMTGDEMPETRNVLIEAARIARGVVNPLSDFRAADFDALIIPGGFGAAKNLCDFAVAGTDCTVNPDMRRAVTAMVDAAKPIGALCIAPTVIAKILNGATVTIGRDEATANAIESMGGHHVKTLHGGVVRDDRYRLVTAPCYMLESTISQIADGAENAVRALLDMVAEAKAAA